MAYERVQKSFGQSSSKKKYTPLVPPIVDHPTQADSQLSSKVKPYKIPSKEERDAIRRSLFEKWGNATPSSIVDVRTHIQTKLTIGAPGDKYEQEADRVASQVVNQINAPVTQQSHENLQPEITSEEDELLLKSEVGVIQREAMPEEEEKLQMKPIMQLQGGAGNMTAPAELESSIEQARSGGQLLADNIREPMEQAFGADFSGVKVHTDAQSDQLSRSIQAKAFTTGQDVFFRSREYQPGSRGGQELLAHELTHVVQQNGGAVSRALMDSWQPSLVFARKGVKDSVQRASELNTTKKLNWDEEGKEGWTSNKSDPSPIAKYINMLVDKGVLKATNVTEFVSAHAIAAAMGGENHERNIVGWDGNTHEKKQQEFEWAVLKGQTTTYTDAQAPYANETGNVSVKAELYGDEKWQTILEKWATTLKDYIVANWATLKEKGLAQINPKIPEDKRSEIDPTDVEILEGIKKSLKAGGHALERVKRIPNNYYINYAPTTDMSGRKFNLVQENLPIVDFNSSADMNTLFEMAKPQKATVIAIAKQWFLSSLT